MSSAGNRNPKSGRTVLASGFEFDTAAAAAHIMEPSEPSGVDGFQGVQEDAAQFKLPFPTWPRPTQRWDFAYLDFAEQLTALLDLNTAGGYVWKLRQGGQPLDGAQRGFAKQLVDGSEPWTENVRMHIASLSKLITGIAMTRTLAAHNLAASTTKIIDYLPSYWVKGPNIDQITFDKLLTHKSGFRVDGSNTYYPIMKSQVEAGVNTADIGQFSYQNVNYSLCRILIPVMNGTVPADAKFPGPSWYEDALWDFATITAYKQYVEDYVFQPAGVSGPTTTHPAADALAYAYPFPSPPDAGWNSGDLTENVGGEGWHISVDEYLTIMGTFRRAGTIMPPTDALNMLDAKYGIDDITKTPLGTLYLKNGTWHANNDWRAEQCVAYFLPDDIELVVFVNSPFTVADTFTGELGRAIKVIYLNNIVPISVALP
jgi:CubicO group peptidase (beta-lactamase class C family)